MALHEDLADVIPPEQMPKDLRVKTGVDFEFLTTAMEALSNPDRLHLLGYLTQPHYLEEIASLMKVSRQAARKHLDKLVEVHILERRASTRDSGPVTEYLINPQALFLIHDEFEKLGSLRRREEEVTLSRTLVAADARTGPPPPTTPCFHVVRGMDTGHRHELGHNERRAWTLGRDPRCDVVVGHDPYASNRHAEVRWEQGGFVLGDLGSTNRTFYNWAPIPRSGAVPLRHGDVVGVGKTLLLFWEPGGRR